MSEVSKKIKAKQKLLLPMTLDYYWPPQIFDLPTALKREIAGGFTLHFVFNFSFFFSIDKVFLSEKHSLQKVIHIDVKN